MMRKQDRGLPAGTFTATMLLGCDRQSVLMAGDKDYFVDPDDEWPKIRGHMVHALMENAPDTPGYIKDIREVRFMVPVVTSQGIYYFAGKPDLIRLKRIEDGVAIIDIVDYKSTSEIGHDKLAASEEHQMQVNMYCWLVAQELPKYLKEKLDISVDSVEVENIEIFYADMKKTRRFVNEYYLKAKGKRIKFNPLTYDTLELLPMQLLPLEIVEEWVCERIEEKLQPELPPVLGEDKSWMCYRCVAKEECAELARKGK
jgi:hypothetical protein